MFDVAKGLDDPDDVKVLLDSSLAFLEERLQPLVNLWSEELATAYLREV